MFSSSGSRRPSAPLPSTGAVRVPTREPVGFEQDTNENILGKDGKVDLFLTKKEQLNELLEKTKKLLVEVQKLEHASGTSPKDLIAAQSRMRQQITLLSNEWSALNNTYNAEMKKRNSKYSRDDMISRGSTLQILRSDIEALKERCREGYTNQNQTRDFWGSGSSRNGNNNSSDGVNRYVEMSESELFKPKGVDHNPGRKDEMTDEHRGQLQVIQDRDKQLDEEIGVIGNGLEDLKKLAVAQNEEVRAQNQILDPLREKIETVHEDMVTNNLRLADALRQVRDGSKLCVDFACIALLIALSVILYELTKL